MNDDDPLDERLALGWQALSPPADSMARVRERVLADVGPGPGGGASGEGSGSAGPGSASPGSAGAGGEGPGRDAGAATGGRGGWTARWQGLRASGALGWAAGAGLLALGFGVGFSLRPALSPPETRAPAALSASDDAPRVEVSPLRPNPVRDATQAPAAHPGLEAHDAPEKPPEPQRPSARTSAPTPGNGERRSARAPRAPSTTRQSARGSGDAEELRVLERAERALRNNQPELSLVLLQTLNETRPSSVFLEERRALELMALCRTTAPESAAARADFVRRFPSSVYAERIANECTSATNLRTLDMNRVEGDVHVKP